MMQKRWNEFTWQKPPQLGRLSSDLRKMGYEPTGRESPFDERGKLWTKGYELVCDYTAIVIRRDKRKPFTPKSEFMKDHIYRYRNSNKVKMPGGYIGSYDWGQDDDRRFEY